MKLYGAIDLHSNNNYTVIIDEQDRAVFRQKLINEMGVVLRALCPYRKELEGIVVESTYNWYWLVDGLREADYRVHLANTSAVRQYEGFKHTNDWSDAFWIAHLLRLGLLPEGYIYPKEGRPVRDLLRKRGQLVRQRTANILSIENLITRNTGKPIHGHQVKQLTKQKIQALFPNPHLALAVESNRLMVEALTGQIEEIEKVVKASAQLEEAFQPLLSVYGIGQTLALTIMLETGDIRRFRQVGDYSSYCRCVESRKLSNGKKKGENNAKCGNKYLAWAFVEAANFAMRYYPEARRFYQRKRAKGNAVLAIKALAHKLARACYYVMRDQVKFEPSKLFGS